MTYRRETRIMDWKGDKLIVLRCTEEGCGRRASWRIGKNRDGLPQRQAEEYIADHGRNQRRPPLRLALRNFLNGV